MGSNTNTVIMTKIFFLCLVCLLNPTIGCHPSPEESLGIILPPQCYDYNRLSDPARHHTAPPNYYHDSPQRPGPAVSSDWKGEGWYRVLDDTKGSNRLASADDARTIEPHCGTYYGGYLLEPGAVLYVGETQNATVCFRARPEDTCHWGTTPIRMTNCGSYVSYYLPDSPSDFPGHTRYCTAGPLV